MLTIALICHSSTGLSIISRIIKLVSINKKEAKYIFLIDPRITNDEIKSLKLPRNIDVKFVKVFSIEIVIKKAWNILFSNFYFAQNKTKRGANKIKKNKRKINKKFNLFYNSVIKTFLFTFLKTSFRLINIFINAIIFFNKKYDYAIFSSDRTNAPTSYLFSLLNKKETKILLIELSHTPDIDFYIRNRKLSYKNYLRPNGLFSKIFPDLIISKRKNFHLSFYHPEETFALFFTGVLPRDPLNILGSLGAKNIICTSDLMYKSCQKSNFLKKQNIINSIPIDTELVLNSINKRDYLRKDLAKKNIIEENKTLSLFSVSDLAHLNLYSEEECENFQLSIIEKILNITKNCLIMLHPRISSNRFSKLRNIYKKRLVSEPLPSISPAIDIFMAFGETSAQEYLLPMGIETIIFYKHKMDLYGDYNNYKNLNVFKYNKSDAFNYLSELNKKNFLNKDIKITIPKNKVRLSEAIFSKSLQ